MADWQNAFEQVKRPQVAIPAGTLLVTGLTAGILGAFLGKWIFVIVALLAILVALLAFLIYALYSREREERLRRGTAQEVSPAIARRREEARDALSLEDHFERAVGVIEARDLGDLPWYLVLGPKGSGKNALLRASGLELPAAVEKLAGQGSTTSCDWWLTNQAVFIDTAGRYLTANEGPDHREWRHLLSLVRKYRPRPALHGVLVVLSAADLLSKPAEEVGAEASELRRHLNEIVDLLGVDPPVYLLVTQADRIQGLVDAAVGLSGGRLQEAFGWTNRQRYPHDAGGAVRDAYAAIRERLEAALPDLLTRESDGNRRRRLFLLPQELGFLAQGLSTFVGRAFAPALYDEAPFLRGVYLTSALRGGDLVSPVVERLAHAPIREAVDASGSPPGGWFARDFFRRILLDAEEQRLAVVTERVGPRTRAVVLGVAYALAAALAVLWSIGFYYNMSAIRLIRQTASDAQGRGLSLDVLDRLRQSVDEGAWSSGLHGVGLGGPLRRAVLRGRETFVAGFGREFEEPAKQNLLAGVRRHDDEAFAALEDLAADVGFLATRGSEVTSAPDLASYSEVHRNDQEKAAFSAAYTSFVRWAPEVEIASRVRAEQDRLDDEAPRLLEISRLEAWCNTHPDVAPPVKYQTLGLPQPGPGETDGVSGCYTRLFYEKQIAGLVENVERSGKASRDSVDQFRAEYERRYTESWATFLVGTPRPPVADPEVVRSPYLNLLAKIDENTKVEGLWHKGAPKWIQKLRAVRSQEAPNDKEPAPWARYSTALDGINSVVERVHGNSHLAFDLARSVGEGQESEFKKAVDLVRKELARVEADDEDRTQDGALQSILLMPILNGFSSVLASAAREVDQMWKDQVVAPFPPPLTPEAHERLYGAGGALERFHHEVLGPFVSGSQARPLLEDRGMPLSPHLLGFVATGGRLAGGGGGGGGGAMPSGPQAVRLVGAPSEVIGSSTVFVTGQELTLVCASRPEQRFEYTDGVGEKVFTWTPDCELVQLVVHVRDAEGHEQEIPREWSGPFAFSGFLREGQPLSDGSYQWTVSDRLGSNVRVAVRYRRRGGEDIIRFEKAASQAPPSSALN